MKRGKHEPKYHPFSVSIQMSLEADQHYVFTFMNNELPHSA